MLWEKKNTNSDKKYLQAPIWKNPPLTRRWPPRRWGQTTQEVLRLRANRCTSLQSFHNNWPAAIKIRWQEREGRGGRRGSSGKEQGIRLLKCERILFNPQEFVAFWYDFIFPRLPAVLLQVVGWVCKNVWRDIKVYVLKAWHLIWKINTEYLKVDSLCTSSNLLGAKGFVQNVQWH